MSSILNKTSQGLFPSVSEACRYIPHPCANHAANVLDVLADDEASNFEKGLALASLGIWMM